MDTVDNYILALLKVAKEENAEVTATKLQKIFFLLEKEGGVNLGLNFEPWLFGPYSKLLQDRINSLIELGMVDVEEEEVKDVISGLTIGIKRKYVLANDVKVDNVRNEIIQFFKEWVSKPRQEILTYVYRRYPDYTRYSVIRDKVIRGKLIGNA
ncbi:conjugal transfer protein [Sulfolobus acidocaldarius]|uniref:Conserved conjugative plasmid protein n=3 Tax=Sulfolobus acidocaldarius TaxID=2285 RepID=Q4JBC2_SULAC|nr:conjugal transfer protein [Sulfolobus acidocaldarius]AAY79907.1 conserved conjugative plasmid protein [Sulfolobus acidocaldarius DSM 639]AGE70473.1 conjugative plasmid protein [Sulfolobus acidocaldarius N8]AGE72746.1 conjugative plasmid protein [Sulfolobus acidocaldarius Ron12/I]WCM34464.1 conjugal transfer protein [Sulfolobus acidocaldarius DSM 639]